MAGSRERKTLQPWVRSALHDPAQGWLCWKVEDKYVPGLPDCIVKSPFNHVSVVELKWSTLKRGIRFEASREQWAHLRQWGPRAYLLVASPALDAIVLAPAEKLLYTDVTLSWTEVRHQIRDERICTYSRGALKHMLRRHLL